MDRSTGSRSGAPDGRPEGGREVRWSARRKQEVVLRLLRGEAPSSMARRRRNKPRSSSAAATPRPPAARDRMARVAVSDEVWAQFRDAAYPHSIAHALGALVQREVDRHRSKRLRDGALDDTELVDALEHARELHGDLTRIVARLERRLDQIPRDSGLTTMEVHT